MSLDKAKPSRTVATDHDLADSQPGPVCAGRPPLVQSLPEDYSVVGRFCSSVPDLGAFATVLNTQ